MYNRGYYGYKAENIDIRAYYYIEYTSIIHFNCSDN